MSAEIDADPVRRARVESGKRAMETVLALAELRNARGVTQQDVAGRINSSQANVSRIEHEEDVYLSTLRAYIEALGGHLEMRAIFPDGEVIGIAPTPTIIVAAPAS
ncbi:MAG: helix-turn-helix domain-containing protein [Chloroflexota bacterium]|nr:helix-turn-helix domain-containing protein [Chloroflexota bacterium]